MFGNYLRFLTKAYILQAPWVFSLSVIMLCCRAGAEAALPLIFGKMIESSQAEVAEQIIYFIITTALIPIFLKLRDTGWARCYSYSMEYTAIAGLSHTIDLDSDWHSNQHSGAITKMISRAVSAVEETGDLLFYNFIPPLVVTFTTCIGLWAAGSSAAYYIAIGMLVFAAASFTHALLVVAPRYAKSAITDSKLFSTLADVLACHNVVTASGNTDSEISYLTKIVRQFGLSLRYAWTANINNYTFQHCVFLGMLLIPAVQAIQTGNISELVRLVTAWFVIRSTTLDMATHIRRLFQQYEYAKAFLQIIDTKPAICEPANAPDLAVTVGAIEFRNVSFAYNNRPALFSNLNLTIPAGKTVALVGHSGCGKTTLAKLLLRLYEPTSGEVLIDHRNIAAYSLKSVRQSIATVFQDIPLFSRTVRENVTYFTPEKNDCSTSIEQSKLTDVVKQLPQGVDSIVGERGVKLSGGEKQRVAIARAIHARRPIVLFDEATSALDTETEAAVHEAITDLMKDRTAIIIAHRLSTVRNADIIIVMDKGQIIETGTHDELLRANGYYSRLCETELV
jgi:ATP-binding cassette subfamily B protein